VIKKILLALVVVFVAFIAAIALRPSTFTVERSIEIAAPSDIPYGLVADLHKWSAWSPWEQIDPDMKRTFEGPEAGVGASYHWDSESSDVGEGKMTVTEATPNQSVGIELEFIRPWEETNQVEFTFAPAGDKTKVTWRMDGALNFASKAVDMFVGLDSMVGPDFEKGLAAMKARAEEEAKKPPA
jgi:hypothetical protein